MPARSATPSRRGHIGPHTGRVARLSFCVAIAKVTAPSKRQSADGATPRAAKVEGMAAFIASGCAARGTSFKQSASDALPFRCARQEYTPSRQPHIAVFMADDLGYLDTVYASVLKYSLFA